MGGGGGGRLFVTVSTQFPPPNRKREKIKIGGGDNADNAKTQGLEGAGLSGAIQIKYRTGDRAGGDQGPS